MRSLALLLVALLTAPAALSQTDVLTKRKPGLWELRVFNDNPVLKQVATKMLKTARMCIDETTDRQLAAAYDPCDPPMFFAMFAPQFRKEVVCKAETSSFKAMTRTTITFTGNIYYRIDLRNRLEMASEGAEEFGSGGREGKWVGPCPADMQPGDIAVGDDPKVNVFDKIAHPDK